MAFGDLKKEDALKSLNNHLATRSYIEGYIPTQADVQVFGQLKSVPSQSLPDHVYRWYKHIESHSDKERKCFLNAKQNHDFPSNAGKETAADDDDVDLFASDEDDAEAEKLKEERVKAYAEKKSKKPALIAKSSVILEVKPWDDETDMKEMENKVRSIVMDGLVWGASKLVPVGYGINKLQIMSVVEDDKVSIDLLQEQIQEFEDFVQSVDIAAFNKI